MQSLWEFVDQQDETQLDFFDLCEPDTSTYDGGLESQANDEGSSDDETKK